jgi:hypothetical protein
LTSHARSNQAQCSGPLFLLDSTSLLLSRWRRRFGTELLRLSLNSPRDHYQEAYAAALTLG